MKIKKSNLKRMILEYLHEDNLAGTGSDVVYKIEAGNYVHVEGAEKDPYEYKVTGGSKGKDIKVKIAKINKVGGKKPKGTVGASFTINKKSLKNPNVQSLYAAIIVNEPDYEIKDALTDTGPLGNVQSTTRGSSTGDFVIVNGGNEAVTSLVEEFKNIDKGEAKLMMQTRDNKPTEVDPNNYKGEIPFAISNSPFFQKHSDVYGKIENARFLDASNNPKGDLGEVTTKIKQLFSKKAANLQKFVFFQEAESPPQYAAYVLLKTDAVNHEIIGLGSFFPGAAGGQKQKAVTESLSRGALYRRRYYGRY